jgi:hypothetical protein
MPDNSARPFLPLVAGPKNRLRQRVRGGSPPPRESAAQHGQNLLSQIEDFQRAIDAHAARRPPDLPPLPADHQVIIEAKRLLPEQMGSLGLTPIEERADGMLVTITPDVTLPTLTAKAQSYISETTGSGHPKFGGVLAPIEKIRPATRNDKAGDRLAALIEAGQLDPNAPIWVDIELAGGRSELGVKNRQEFNDYLNQFSLELPPYAEEVVTATGAFLVEEDYSLHRVYLPGKAVLDLLDDSRANWILSLDLIPDIEEGMLSLPAGAGAQLPAVPRLANNAPRVVIIDSGIAANHPLFTDAQGHTLIGRQRNFLPDSVEAANQTGDDIDHGHGTAIASIVAYGSLAEAIRHPNNAAPPAFWLENAKIALPAAWLKPDASGNTPQFHPGQFPKALMREVVTAFHHPLPQQCKIFNLSLNGGLHPLQSISNWAEELDNLSAQNDVLFVVCGGGVSLGEIADALQAGEEYPLYLLNELSRLRNPGQAYNALTVGAMTDAAPNPPWQRDRGLAPPQHPAPFSRSGLLQYGPLKPDVVETGGNLIRSGSELTATPEAAVLVANRDFATGQAEQPLGFHLGAGLAAAKVTHLAGRIQAQYPQAGANLIRALIANSADWPPAFVQSFVTRPDDPLPKAARQMLLRLCGYGVPQPDKALSSNEHCLVFVAEDEFSWTKDDRNSSSRYPAKVSFFSIKFEPDDLYRLPPATRVRVSVTLAYNPPVRKTQRRRYQAIDMRWDLKRREEDSEDFYARWMREVEGSAEESEPEEEVVTRPLPPWPWELKPALNPGSKVRRGTLIRDWFDAYAHELPNALELVVLAMVAPWRRPPEPLAQKFALVVSVEALDHQLPLYDAVRVQSDNDERSEFVTRQTV